MVLWAWFCNAWFHLRHHILIRIPHQGLNPLCRLGSSPPGHPFPSPERPGSPTRGDGLQPGKVTATGGPPPRNSLGLYRRTLFVQEFKSAPRPADFAGDIAGDKRGSKYGGWSARAEIPETGRRGGLENYRIRPSYPDRDTLTAEDSSMNRNGDSGSR